MFSFRLGFETKPYGLVQQRQRSSSLLNRVERERHARAGDQHPHRGRSLLAPVLAPALLLVLRRLRAGRGCNRIAERHRHVDVAEGYGARRALQVIER